jgi:hypothetical protein
MGFRVRAGPSARSRGFRKRGRRSRRWAGHGRGSGWRRDSGASGGRSSDGGRGGGGSALGERELQLAFVRVAQQAEGLPEERLQSGLLPLKKLAGVMLALAGGIGLAAYLYVRNEPYYPVARVAAPGGLTYTAFSGQTRGREACVSANELFVEPLRKDCPACTVLFERCESRAEMMKLRVAAVSDPVVLSRGLALAVAGPGELARATCELIAQDLVKRGLEGSRCLKNSNSGSGS